MADPFVAEIRMVGSNFAPNGWALCNGQILAISQNTALFALIGTSYGGDGVSTFALPNFQGNVPVGMGNGAGLSPNVLGETGGQTQVTLTTAQLPTHVHPIGASLTAAVTNMPSPAVSLGVASAAAYGAPVNMGPMGSQSVGGNQPHENRQPFLPLTFVIALQGIFPSRN
jgi:microcystin-dependent protein